jgi:hypothetical protein
MSKTIMMTKSGLLPLVLAASMLALTATGAFAQAAGGVPGSDSDSGGFSMPGIGIGGGSSQDDSATAEKRKEIEQQYRDALRKQQSQAAASNDPWANMRGPTEDQPKTAAKTRHTKKRTTAR